MGIEKQKGTVSTLSLVLVFIGYGITINAVGIGASLGQGMTLQNGVIAMVIGTIILSFLAGFSALMGERARYSTAVIWRYIYGSIGGRIPSVLVGVSMTMWSFFDMWYVGAALKGIFKGIPHIPFIIGEIIILGFCIYGALNGLQALAKIATLTIPIAVILFTFVTVRVAQISGGLSVMSQYVPSPENQINMATGINIVVGHFISCTGLWGDLTCEAKKKSACFIAVTAGMLANMSIHFVGQFGVIGLGAFGLDAVANAVGGVLMIVLHIFTIFAVINTTPSTFHLVKIHFGDAFGNPRFWAIVAPIFTMCGAFVVEYVISLSFISYWSIVATSVLGPIVGVSLAEFWFGLKGECPEEEMPPAFRKVPVASIVIAFLFTLFCNINVPFVPISFVGPLFGFVLQFVLIKVFHTERKSVADGYLETSTE